jgi:pilus assembly protein Flp/PilA
MPVNGASALFPKPKRQKTRYPQERRSHEGVYVIRIWQALMEDDTAQGLVEYALIIALVSIVAIAALQVLGQKASNTLSNTANSLS